jgi:hypothetical protein
MTPTQQAAYTALAQAKSETTWRAALPAFKASVDGPETDVDTIPLQALCMALEFIAEIATDDDLHAEFVFYMQKARELLGWQ